MNKAFEVTDPSQQQIAALQSERPVQLSYVHLHWKATFFALGSPCEVLIRTTNQNEASAVANCVAYEAWRIELKYSRYRQDGWLNHLHSQRLCELDDESVKLIAFGLLLYEATGGSFDLTAGVLRKAWKFGSDGNAAAPQLIPSLLPFVGWDKVHYTPPFIQVPKGMQLDFGGVGKEYAADSALAKAKTLSNSEILLNLGGDICCTPTQLPWVVGIQGTTKEISLLEGGLATSGTTERYIKVGDTRYGHILDAKTGYPIAQAPLSISVHGSSCSAAGATSTIAMTKGPQAEQWLMESDVRYYLA